MNTKLYNKLIRDKIPDLAVPFSEYRTFNYFYEDTIKKYAQQYKWDIITATNIKGKFIEFIERMDMSYSYKPVLIKAIFDHIDDEGKVRIIDIVDYFINFYHDRKTKGMLVEKKPCIYLRDDISKKEVEKNIFSNPLKRFADMKFLERTKDLEHIEMNPSVFSRLTKNEINAIIKICDKKLEEYYQ